MSELTLTVGGKILSGWEKVRVTRGIERVPGDFTIETNSRSLLAQEATGIVEGQNCTVSLDGARVISGYVDAVQASYSARDHRIVLAGRGKCADLVDCSAEWPTAQIGNTNLYDIASKLAVPYGISVRTFAGDLTPIPQFNVSVGETPWSMIDKMAREENVLAYEDSNGDLVFDRAGSVAAASGLQEGANVQAATYTRTVADRYQKYMCALVTLQQLSGAGPSTFFYSEQTDPNVKRNRKLYMEASRGYAPQALCASRAVWEMNRRFARGNTVTAVVDSWRDAAGKLWTPNTLVPVSLPALGVRGQRLCLGEVTYSLDAESGTTAELTLAPPAAYAAEPIQLQPLIAGAD